MKRPTMFWIIGMMLLNACGGTPELTTAAVPSTTPEPEVISIDGAFGGYLAPPDEPGRVCPEGTSVYDIIDVAYADKTIRVRAGEETFSYEWESDGLKNFAQYGQRIMFRGLRTEKYGEQILTDVDVCYTTDSPHKIGITAPEEKVAIGEFGYANYIMPGELIDTEARKSETPIECWGQTYAALFIVFTGDRKTLDLHDNVGFIRRDFGNLFQTTEVGNYGHMTFVRYRVNNLPRTLMVANCGEGVGLKIMEP
jgi:hypothetical protein